MAATLCRKAGKAVIRALNHTVKHRGQLSMYLCPMGGKVFSIHGEGYDVMQTHLARD